MYIGGLQVNFYCFLPYFTLLSLRLYQGEETREAGQRLKQSYESGPTASELATFSNRTISKSSKTNFFQGLQGWWRRGVRGLEQWPGNIERQKLPFCLCCDMKAEVHICRPRIIPTLVSLGRISTAHIHTSMPPPAYIISWKRSLSHSN